MRTRLPPRRAAWAVPLALSAFCLLAVPAAGAPHAQPAEGAAPAPRIADAPLTVAVTRYVRPGCEVRFEALIRETFQSGDLLAGRISTEFLPPAEPNSHAYTVIYRFNGTAQYRRMAEVAGAGRVARALGAAGRWSAAVPVPGPAWKSG